MYPPHNWILYGVIPKNKVDISHGLIGQDVQDIVLHERSMWQNNVYSMLPFL